jgi:hypothetical protein
MSDMTPPFSNQNEAIVKVPFWAFKESFSA